MNQQKKDPMEVDPQQAPDVIQNIIIKMFGQTPHAYYSFLNQSNIPGIVWYESSDIFHAHNPIVVDAGTVTKGEIHPGG